MNYIEFLVVIGHFPYSHIIIFPNMANFYSTSADIELRTNCYSTNSYVWFEMTSNFVCYLFHDRQEYIKHLSSFLLKVIIRIIRHLITPRATDYPCVIALHFNQFKREFSSIRSNNRSNLTFGFTISKWWGCEIFNLWSEKQIVYKISNKLVVDDDQSTKLI